MFAPVCRQKSKACRSHFYPDCVPGNLAEMSTMENIEIKFRVPERLPGRVSPTSALKSNLHDRRQIKLLPFCLPAILIITLCVYYFSLPAPYFRPPLDLSTTVAGTFGE